MLCIYVDVLVCVKGKEEPPESRNYATLRACSPCSQFRAIEPRLTQVCYSVESNWYHYIAHRCTVFRRDRMSFFVACSRNPFLRAVAHSRSYSVFAYYLFGFSFIDCFQYAAS